MSNQFSSVFSILHKEALFTNELLGAGVTQIRKANYARKGLYFQSFGNLATGLERLGKLCFILDFFIKNNKSFPSDRDLKSLGHDLLKINILIDSIANDKNYSYNHNIKNDSISISILKILCDFANGDRYSNISTLHNPESAADPILKWSRDVDCALFKACISKNKKTMIKTNAKHIDELIFNAIIIYTSDNNTPIETIGNSAEYTGIFHAVAPHRQLYLLQIIKCWVNVLVALQNEAKKISNNDIPFFNEIFTLFLIDDKLLRRKKSYSKY